MGRGKYHGLEGARNLGKLDGICKELPSETDTVRFERLLDAMLRKDEREKDRDELRLSLP